MVSLGEVVRFRPVAVAKARVLLPLGRHRNACTHFTQTNGVRVRAIIDQIKRVDLFPKELSKKTGSGQSLGFPEPLGIHAVGARLTSMSVHLLT